VNTSETVKKAQQRLHFLRVLRKNNLECKLIVAAPLSKVYSPTASRRGTPVAPQQTREPSKGSSTQHKKSLAAHCPPWNPLPAPATLAGPITSYKTPLTQATTCLLSCPQADGTDPLEHGPRVLRTVFFPDSHQNSKYRHALNTKHFIDYKSHTISVTLHMCINKAVLIDVFIEVLW